MWSWSPGGSRQQGRGRVKGRRAGGRNRKAARRWAGLRTAGTFFNKLQQAGRQPPLSPLSSTSSILPSDWLHTSRPQVAELRLVGTKCPGALLAGAARLRSVNFELGPVKPVLGTKLPAAAPGEQLASQLSGMLQYEISSWLKRFSSSLPLSWWIRIRKHYF